MVTQATLTKHSWEPGVGRWEQGNSQPPHSQWLFFREMVNLREESRDGEHRKTLWRSSCRQRV